MSQKIPFSERPGRHERHFRRKLTNALLPRGIAHPTDAQLLEVQRLDHEELVAFTETLQGLVVKAINLPPNVESEVVIDLKEQLDKAYETSAGLADDQTGNQSAIRELTAVIMRTISRNTSGDAVANAELQQETLARTAHYALLQQPLVADLLHPHTLIEADELVPLLLGERPEALAAALELFDAQQLAEIASQAGQRVTQHPADPSLQDALVMIEQQLQAASPQRTN
jgi:hypothetical protein